MPITAALMEHPSSWQLCAGVTKDTLRYAHNNNNNNTSDDSDSDISLHTPAESFTQTPWKSHCSLLTAVCRQSSLVLVRIVRWRDRRTIKQGKTPYRRTATDQKITDVRDYMKLNSLKFMQLCFLSLKKKRYNFNFCSRMNEAKHQMSVQIDVCE